MNVICLKSKLYSDFIDIEITLHKFPIDNFIEMFNIFFSLISIIDIISMFPDINCQ